MYYVAPETPMMSSVIADCPDLVPPQDFGQVYASGQGWNHVLTFAQPQQQMPLWQVLQSAPLTVCDMEILETGILEHSR